MSPVTDRDQILEALGVVIDPELHRSIVELDMVRSIDVSANGVVDVTVSLTTPDTSTPSSTSLTRMTAESNAPSGVSMTGTATIAAV